MISSVWHVINTQSLLMYSFYCSLPRPVFHNAMILRIALGLWCEEGVAERSKPNFLTRGLLRHLEPNESSQLALKPLSQSSGPRYRWSPSLLPSGNQTSIFHRSPQESQRRCYQKQLGRGLGVLNSAGSSCFSLTAPSATP